MPALPAATATMLLTLAARARASAGSPMPDMPAFADPEACRIAAALPGECLAYAQDIAFVRSVVLRSLLFDRLTAEFFAAHPSGLCIALGAGLCTRRTRLAAQTGAARWLNVDLPEAIALRERHVASTGAESNIACSILDSSWMDAAGLPGNTPVLVLLEGVCPYLPQAALEAMLAQLAQRMSDAGAPACTVVLDHVHPLLARLPMQVGGMRLPVVSGFEDASQLTRIHASIRVDFEAHPYAQFSPQHQLFETALHATTGQHAYAIVRLALAAHPLAPKP